MLCVLQLMFGPDYMLAPQLKQGQQNRSVYLPVLADTAQRWQSFFTGELFVGGQELQVATPWPGTSFPLFQLVAGH